MNQQQERNWWSRNWKWCLPVGCLGSLTLFAAFVAAIVFMVFGLIKSSDAYKDAVARVKTDQSVQKAIGTPIKEGVYVTGQLNINGPSGQANLAIPVSGPGGKATIYVVATKSAGQWTYSTLVVETRKTGERIDLLRSKTEPGNVSEHPVRSGH